MEQQFSENLTLARFEAQCSKSVREYSVPQIPDDLLIIIFSLVTGKSVARFRCVSKHWASVLRRSDFTELFWTKSLTRPRLLFTINFNGKLFFYSVPQPHNPDDNSSLVATPYQTCSFPKRLLANIFKPLCGLALLMDEPVICNPATGEFLTLPKVLLEEKDLPNPKEFSKMFCLGYDPVGKQFKVLCMTSSSFDERLTTHLVLTLESRKPLWRKVELKFLFVRNRRMSYGSICINGVLYFGAEFGKSTVMVCFDVRSEKFRFINTDEVMEQDRRFELFNYKGKLGIHRNRYNRYENRYENRFVLWVLEDARNHKWFKHVLELSPYEEKMVENTKIVGMTGTGEIVFASYSYLPISWCRVVFYNMERKTFTRVKIEGFEVEEPRVKKYIDTLIDYAENVEFM
ncbi:PREDICTED: putative F-box protein At1g53360 [Brassica oleracea var. oleracea]|uniref:putative F-box protein At1g53360 n=1 Tax=Brassica oleracea var. oleracea TaxID=109376 RepID=UPI0006A72D88|nr:PREDICTED: putative F-box protein At1g53360 [Brassica oleracea var. oleracea]